MWPNLIYAEPFSLMYLNTTSVIIRGFHHLDRSIYTLSEMAQSCGTVTGPPFPVWEAQARWLHKQYAQCVLIKKQDSVLYRRDEMQRLAQSIKNYRTSMPHLHSV